MKPIQFPEQTIVLRKPANMTDEECASLPVFTDGEQVISCWALTWRERFRVLVSGRVWLGVLSGRTQPPVYIVAKAPFAPSPSTTGGDK